MSDSRQPALAGMVIGPSRQASHTPEVSVPPARDRTTSRQRAFSGAPRMVSRVPPGQIRRAAPTAAAAAAVSAVTRPAILARRVRATQCGGAGIGVRDVVATGSAHDSYYAGALPGVHAGARNSAASQPGHFSAILHKSVRGTATHGQQLSCGGRSAAADSAQRLAQRSHRGQDG